MNRQRLKRVMAEVYDDIGWLWPIALFGVIWLGVMVKFS